jgi:hypothetical protein
MYLLLIPIQKVFSGQFLNFGIVVFGITYNNDYIITDGTVQIGIDGKPSSFLLYKSFGNCSFVSYQMARKYSQSDEKLYIQVKTDSGSTRIKFKILPCPIGFTLSSTTDMCDCSPVIGGVNVTCD